MTICIEIYVCYLNLFYLLDRYMFVYIHKLKISLIKKIHYIFKKAADAAIFHVPYSSLI